MQRSKSFLCLKSGLLLLCVLFLPWSAFASTLPSVGFYYGSGPAPEAFHDFKDVAQANVAALTGKVQGSINIARGEATTILNLAKTIQQLVSTPSNIEWVPPVEGDILHSIADNERMRKHLCQSFWSLSEGIQDLLRVPVI
jgi:UDP-glucose 4-epimerase